MEFDGKNTIEQLVRLYTEQESIAVEFMIENEQPRQEEEGQNRK